MIETLFNLIVLLVWLVGAFYFAPKFAARDATKRGLARVDGLALYMGVTRALFWMWVWMIPYIEKRANIEMGKDPEVRYLRAMIQAQKSDEMERALHD